eukprot:CAMPEP_0183720730 /NCGR_PEP_ID=MMETSP0737-20130205/13260_1 /TAXON_ID=385413 /ORGANISM="Thalassiosira miniscula, Strain CCMP1093" /LENGTH=1706 /DNA_ID=CAMNT_0025950645 /DNA_START=265 /DNA_END=5385 /DNA_ORIENTATION=-
MFPSMFLCLWIVYPVASAAAISDNTDAATPVAGVLQGQDSRLDVTASSNATRPCSPSHECMHNSKCEYEYLSGDPYCNCSTAVRDDGRGEGALFAGKYCEYEASAVCSDSLGTTHFCINGGTCDIYVDLKCRCPVGYDGKHCEFESLYPVAPDNDFVGVDGGVPDEINLMEEEEMVDGYCGTTWVDAATWCHKPCQMSGENSECFELGINYKCHRRTGCSADVDDATLYPPSPVPSFMGSQQSEYDALLAFYSHYGGNTWVKNNLWASNDVSICEWYGVQCGTSGSVSHLELKSNGLSGRLDVDVLKWLPDLAVLDLGSNGLWGTIPDSFGNLKKLKSLTLANNPLRGPIPGNLSRLPMLEELDLSLNSFNIFEISEGGYSKLRALVLDNNIIRGTIPKQVFSMTALETISMSENRLTGMIPHDFSFLANLTTLDLHSNDLSGTLPYLNFERLEINVSGNSLTGIAEEACLADKWNNGDVAIYGCDGIACPVGKGNPQGRQSSSSTPCIDCPGSDFIGTIECLTYSPTFVPTPRPTYIPTETPRPTDTPTKTSSPTYTPTIDPSTPPNDNNECKLECRNGGICTQDSKGYREWCTCPPRYTGFQCESLAIFFRPTPPPSIAQNYWPASDIIVPPGCTFYATSSSGRLSSFEKFCGGGAGYADLGPLSDFAVDPITSRGVGIRGSEMFEFDLDRGSILRVGLTPTEKGQTLQALFEAIGFANGFQYVTARHGNEDEITQISSLYEMDPETLEIYHRGPSFDTPIVGLAHWPNKAGGKMYAVSSCDHNSNLYEVDLDTKQSNILCGDMPACFESLAFIPNEYGGTLYGGTNDGCIARIVIKGCRVYNCDTTSAWHSHFANVTGLGAVCPPTPPTPSPTEQIPYDNEKDHLSKFYESTRGQNWLINTNWLSDQIDKCNWYGLECDFSGRVSGISLPSNRVRVPSSFPSVWKYLEYLPNLKVLNLSNNELSGSMPSFAKLSKLQIVDFRGNSISGSLSPDFLLSATFLQHLDLSENEITGNLHSWIPPASLKYLNFSSNYLASSIPVELGLNNGVGLEFLDLSNNWFTFEFQESFYRNMENLTSLRLSHNRLVGTLTSYEGVYYPKLKELDVSHNSMEGEIPQNLFEGNQLATGAIRLDISHNRFRGAFPNLQLDRLYVDAAGNRFLSLADDACQHTEWNDGDILSFGCDGLMCPPKTSNTKGRQSSDGGPCLRCEAATFYGTTECASDALLTFYENTSGEKWARSDNWFSENSSPCDWYGITCDGINRVSAISLPANGLEGYLDTKLFAQLKGIETIDLSQNALTSFDLCADCLLNLRVLNLRGNFLSGTLANDYSALGNLQELDLSSNSISGKLPSFNHAAKLQSLNVSMNKLTGTIPAELMQSSFGITAVKEPFVLDFSFNRLEGVLPSLEVESLDIEVAGNLLTGLDDENCGRWSWNRRHVYLYGCDGIACPPATANAQGRQTSSSSPCIACPSAMHYGTVDCSDDKPQSPPIQCPDNHQCQNGAKCVPSNSTVHGYTCDCKPNGAAQFEKFAGMFCEYEASQFCSDSPDVAEYAFCTNGGRCKEVGISKGSPFRGCDCASNFFGEHCEKNVADTTFELNTTNPPSASPVMVSNRTDESSTPIPSDQEGISTLPSLTPSGSPSAYSSGSPSGSPSSSPSSVPTSIVIEKTEEDTAFDISASTLVGQGFMIVIMIGLPLMIAFVGYN